MYNLPNDENIEVLDMSDVIFKEIISVEDYDINDKKYMKLTYNDGTVRAFENTKPETGQMIFEVLKNTRPSEVTDLFHKLIQTEKEIDVSLLVSDDIDNSTSITQSKQKRLGAHPGVGYFFHSFTEKDGFTNLLFFIFLTGISIGMVLMIVFNIVMK